MELTSWQNKGVTGVSGQNTIKCFMINSGNFYFAKKLLINFWEDCVGMFDYNPESSY